MPRKFDEKQKLVLESVKTNQLVSAGAGSGKTTVMIEKITNLILSGEIKPNELIVLTFTNQAGSEMKQKLLKSITEQISQAESEEEFLRLNNLRDEINMASIDTIDGFCSKLIKKYFFKLDLSPDINIASNMALDYYLQKSIDEAIQIYEEKEPQLIENLCDCFEKNARSLDALKENVINAFNFVMSQKDYMSFIEFSKNEYRGEYASANFINTYVVNVCNKFVKEVMYYLGDIQSAKSVYEAMQNTVSLLNDIKLEIDLFKNLNLLKNLPQVRFNPPKDDYAFSYGIIKNEFQNLKKLRDDTITLTNYGVGWKSNTQVIDTFLNLLIEFINCYNETKKKYKVMDFTDLEQNMLKLLSIKEIRDEIHEQYKYIFIDEYQDINPMQDAIIEGLKSEQTKMFFVGDVKQSIYGFRQSSPEMFLDKYKSYKVDENSASFDMNINFRTAPSILKFNNEIFSKLMTEEKTDINYDKDSRFEPKREDIPQNNEDVEIVMFNNKKSDEDYVTGVYSVKNASTDSREIMSSCEARYIADKIKSLVGKEFYDTSIKENRLMRFSDITILSRSINDYDCKVLVEVLKQAQIPISISNKIALQEAETIKLVVSILKLVANQFDDISLMAYFVTNLANFTVDEVYKIVLNTTSESLIERLYEYIKINDELAIKINYALNLLEEIRTNSYVLNNLELIDLIMNKYNLKQYILTTINGESELKSLNNFLESLGDFERKLPLEEFINYLELNLLGKADYSEVDDNDAVVIQTIHASKGLEYPVVIMFNASKKFRPNNYQDDVNFDCDLGIGLPYFDLEKRVKWDSLPRFAIKLKNKIKCYKEELRLFYVAVTRPQNKLIITGELDFSKIFKGNIPLDNYLGLTYSVFKDKVNLDSEKTTLKNCVFYLYDEYMGNADIKETEDTVSISINGKNLNFSYENNEVTNISLKNNVTAVSKELNDDYNILPRNLKTNENLDAMHDSSREIGTMYHAVFSKFDFSKSSYDGEFDEVLDKKLIDMAFKKLSNISRGAENIMREAPFLMYLPYNEIYKDSMIEDKILIQGVVDMIIEFKDKIILIDYKLSNSPSAVLKKRYETQLKLYKMAIEKAFKKEVEASLIYNIKTGELI